MIAKVFKSGNSMALRIPRELKPKTGEVSIQQVGNAWLIEPSKNAAWPGEFFRQIRIEDSGFKRPPQGRHRAVSL